MLDQHPVLPKGTLTMASALRVPMQPAFTISDDQYGSFTYLPEVVGASDRAEPGAGDHAGIGDARSLNQVESHLLLGWLLAPKPQEYPIGEPRFIGGEEPYDHPFYQTPRIA